MPKNTFKKGHKFISGGEKGWFKKGQKPWNFGVKGIKMSEEQKSKISKANKGKKKPPRSKEHTQKIIVARSWYVPYNKGKKGKPLSTELRKKWREVQLKRVQDGRHNNYKGGITPINERIRKSLEYRIWRESVFKRDNWTCVWCGDRGGKLNADHIKPFALYPELRFAIDNGRTLCVPCHKKTETFGHKTR